MMQLSGIIVESVLGQGKVAELCDRKKMTDATI